MPSVVVLGTPLVHGDSVMATMNPALKPARGMAGLTVLGTYGVISNRHLFGRQVIEVRGPGVLVGCVIEDADITLGPDAELTNCLLLRCAVHAGERSKVLCNCFEAGCALSWDEGARVDGNVFQGHLDWERKLCV